MLATVQWTDLVCGVQPTSLAVPKLTAMEGVNVCVFLTLTVPLALGELYIYVCALYI